MDATPSFGVSMISEVPSNPQLKGVLLNDPGRANKKLLFI